MRFNAKSLKLNKTKVNKIAKIALAVLWWIAVVCLAVVMTTVITAKMKGKVPKIFGYSVVNIVSGSMDDTLPVDSYALIKSVPADEIKKGDIICFYSTDPAIYGMPNTHRVVEEPIITDSGIEFVTRGDASHTNDKYNAREDMLVGVCVDRLVFLEDLSGFVKNNSFLLFIIGMQVCVCGMVAYIIIKGKNKDGEAEQSSEE